MTHRPPCPDCARDEDTEMPDVDSQRGPHENRPQLPARVHSQAQAAAVAATSITERFVSAFWGKDEGKSSCDCCAPDPPPHRTMPENAHLNMPEPSRGPINELPADLRVVERQNCQQSDPPAGNTKGELEEKIKQLETSLADAPSADSVRALERSLQAEIAQKEKAEREVRQKNDDLDALRKRWKQAARELDKMRSQSQGFYQVTDNHLIELVRQLRYNIRNFCIQYFDGELDTKPPAIERSKLWDKYMKPTTPRSSDFELFLLSERRPSIIQGFIWRFLVGQVFDNFRWAGEIGVTLRNMCLYLRPEGQYSNAEDPLMPEEERKFQTWLASTTGMVLDIATAPHNSETHGDEVKEKVDSLVEKICIIIDRYAKVKDQAYTSEIARILEEAIDLDKEICRQVARVEWVYPSSSEEVVFDAKMMKLGTGEKGHRGMDKQLVQLVICPAVGKRGKSTGDGFEAPPAVLIPMEVSCEPPS